MCLNRVFTWAFLTSNGYQRGVYTDELLACGVRTEVVNSLRHKVSDAEMGGGTAGNPTPTSEGQWKTIAEAETI